MFEDHPLRKAVHPSERRDVFDDVTFTLAKRERVCISMHLLIVLNYCFYYVGYVCDTVCWYVTGTRKATKREKLSYTSHDYLAEVIRRLFTGTYVAPWHCILAHAFNVLRKCPC